MLDFASLKSQINRMIEEKKDFASDSAGKIALALAELKAKSENWQALSEKESMSKTSWLTAGISSPLDSVHPLPARPRSYTAISSDGSQIFPDRHEPLSCFLINISSVHLGYGDRARASMQSRPRLFWSDEDRFVQWGGKIVPADADVISEKRNLMEFQQILTLAEGLAERGDTVAITDGTLIFWRLEGMPADFKGDIIGKFNSIMDALRAMEIPVASYISYPGSRDVVNTLRLGLCPEKISYCDRCPYTQLPELPCAPIQDIADRTLFSRVLDAGQRSPVFESASKVLELYGEHRVYFFYINVGAEIARVEIPKWVAENAGLLDLVHTVIYDQAKKGDGYPVALREAHERAVVRGKQRDFFYDLIREEMAKSDIKIAVSRKGLSKRSPEI
ncbi:MAG: DNA double-strand break repair nuclease NurA [Deltaproteobacteria bacterium]